MREALIALFESVTISVCAVVLGCVLLAPFCIQAKLVKALDDKACHCQPAVSCCPCCGSGCQCQK